MYRTNRLHFAAALLAATIAFCNLAAGIQITSYFSPRNRERPRRPHTWYIILHTTEGSKKGSLNKVRKNGECHYFVDTGGSIYRIIDRQRTAYHAGRSMWNGKTNIDNYSIGIEVVGYHDKPMTSSQYGSLKALIAELQRIYKLADDHVIPHSMVAYAAPNRWHRSSHRGRKRCGMFFADRTVRLKLGLTSQPMYDPDVRARRLAVGDSYLADVLFGSARISSGISSGTVASGGNVIARGRSAWDIAGGKYKSPGTLYTFPDGSKRRGNQISDWTAIPAGTVVTLYGQKPPSVEPAASPAGSNGRSATELAGDAANAKTTIYFLPDGKIRRGDEIGAGNVAKLPTDTKVLLGYIYGGRITSHRSAFDICGDAWNSRTTVYRLTDGTMLKGDAINENSIPKNTHVFFKSN
ncbi:MAG: peptidoglycan recognition family protein [Kiritimatiellia bacterium]|jgi:hypothetical protein|nr:peptidoglycan recognition family protein [Kiritimatiellia bacterium]